MPRRPGGNPVAVGPWSGAGRLWGFQTHVWGKAEACEETRGPAAPPHAHTRPHLGSRTARLSWVFTQTLTQHHAARKKCGAGENGVPWQALNPGTSTASVLLGAPPPRSPPPIIRPRNGKDSRAQASCGGWMELGGTQGAGPPLPGPSWSGKEPEGNAHVVIKSVMALGAKGKRKPHF